MEISEAEFVSLWTGTQDGFKSIWYIVLTLSPLSSFLPRTAVASDLNYVSFFSVFLKSPCGYNLKCFHGRTFSWLHVGLLEILFPALVL